MMSKERKEVKEDQNISKAETVPTFIDRTPLDPAILAMIQESVKVAVAALVPEVIAAVAPKPTVASEPLLQPVVATKMNPNPPPAQQPVYKTRLQGIPVNSGQDLRHVHPQEIKNWFARLENRWKENYAKKQAAALGSSVSLTLEAGTPFPFAH
jgi:hypothetical protein